MIDTIKKLSPATFGLALICFFLPFTHTSCQGERIATLTGIQLVTGTTIEGPSMDFGSSPGLSRPGMGKKDAEKVNPDPLAILALCTAISGFGLSFLKGKTGSVAAAVTGGLGLVFLLLLKAKIDNEVLKEGEGILRVEYGSGFWLVLVLFLCAIGLNVFLLSQMKKEEGVLALS